MEFRRKAKLSEIILKKVRNKETTWEDFAKNDTIKALTENIHDFIKNEK
jgi:hypothetical protein